MQLKCQWVSILWPLNCSGYSSRTPRTTSVLLPAGTPGSTSTILQKPMSSHWRSQGLVESVSYSRPVSSLRLPACLGTQLPTRLGIQDWSPGKRITPLARQMGGPPRFITIVSLIVVEVYIGYGYERVRPAHGRIQHLCKIHQVLIKHLAQRCMPRDVDFCPQVRIQALSPFSNNTRNTLLDLKDTSYIVVVPYTMLQYFHKGMLQVFLICV
jgi:hypothetical protein